MKLYTPILLVLPDTTDHVELLQQTSQESYGDLDQESVWATQADENISIELVRELQQKLQFQPISTIRLVYIPHLEKASPAAQQALLKLLEEPPSQTQVYVTTTNLSSVLATIQSRCLVRLNQELSGTESQERGEQLYQRISSSTTVAQILTISGEYNQKSTAQQACQDLLTYLHHKVEQEQSAQFVLQLTSLLLALERLSGNISPRLVLEEMWFSWLKAE